MHHRHIVKGHRWENGMMFKFEQMFNTFEDAKSYAETVDAHTVKVYSDVTGELVYHVSVEDKKETYA
jgi:hypothetical protein